MNYRFRSPPRQIHLIDLPLFGLVIITSLIWLAPFWAFADLFRQVWPIWVVAATAVLAWVLVARAPRRIITAALLAALLIPAAGTVSSTLRMNTVATLPAGLPVTFATHNLWGRNRTPDQAVAVLESIDADILALQESGVRTRTIHEALEDHYPYEVSCRRAPVRIFSRLPVVESGCLRNILEENRSEGEPLWRWDFPAAAWARIELPNGETFTVISVHFTWPNPLSPQNEERINFAEIAQIFNQESLVILGDFNAAAPSSALARFDRDLIPTRRTHSMASWPSQGRWTNEEGHTLAIPTMFAGIDHIYAGERWVTSHMRVGPDTGSDHRPITGSLIFLEADPGD